MRSSSSDASLLGCKSFLFRISVVIASTLGAGPLNAQSTTTAEEQYKQIRAPKAIAQFGPDLFGDRVNLYNGSLQFIQTDVSLPGNNALPVSMGRRFVAGQDALGDRPFARWDMEIPHLHGVFSSKDGWAVGGTNRGARCSQFGSPPEAVGFRNLSVWDSWEFWHGSFMYIPGAGDQQMLGRASDFTLAPGPTANYPVVTTAFWSMSCLPSLANDTTAGKTMGEGFAAISPDGVTYRFDWMVSFRATGLNKPDDTDPKLFASLVRKEVWILPTLVSDRFGNWVRYTYNAAAPANLLRIDSSDGRVITLTYDATTPNRVKTVSDGTRTWTYSYGSADLASVTLPDGSAWQFGSTDAVNARTTVSLATSCDSPSGFDNTTLKVLTMTHPSGATGSFTVRGTLHGRSDIPRTCDSASGWAQIPSPFFYTQSLTNKTITGPGLASMTWSYDYGPVNASFAPCGVGCAKSKTVSVTDSKGNVTRHTFGNQYDATEGRLEQVDEGGVRTTTTRYRAFGAGPYPKAPGYSDGGTYGDSTISFYLAPVDQRVITQDGVDFAWEANAFDTLARPTLVTRYSSLGGSPSEQTEYKDNYPLWVLGRTGKVTEVASGKVMVANTYDDPTANLLSVSQFGHLDKSMTYYPDGTVQTQRDGLNHTTTYANYKRGIAQNITYANGTAVSAAVDNLGNITSITDATNATTSYGYDQMGRISSIAQPTGDSVLWNATTISFSQVWGQEFDLASGHWRQTITTGTGKEVNYLDAFWRTVYTERWDDADRTNTSRIVKRQYDFNGRSTFESYPKRTVNEISGGVYHDYDPLGRPTETRTDSELGTLYERFSYGGGFTKTHTDAKGNATTYTYQVLDQPSEAAITSISAAEGVRIDIQRDLFDKPTSITRSGNGLSATRSYVYDANERLCKTIELETGATVQDYDLSNNVSWRATGLSLPGTTSCDNAVANIPGAKMVSYGYDALNRLTSTSYGDGSPAVTRTYTADGLPDTVSSDAAVWSYSYNKRRLSERESLAYGGAIYAIGRTYDANGNVSTLSYPNGLNVAYNPNALGEARQVGGFASNINYFPNGAVAGFVYGNGVVHTLTQNARGLPQQSIDSGVLNDSYAYDANGNVTSVTDLQQTGNSRSMSYDKLDRVQSVSAPSLWGTAAYTYDALDNITSVWISAGETARSTTLSYDATTNLLASMAGTSGYNYGYGYDSRGNIVQRGAQSFIFDLANRLTSAPGKATYRYDGYGRRVSVVGNDGLNRIAVYSQEGKLIYTQPGAAAGTNYIYLDRHLLAEAGPDGVEYDHTDALGSPVAVTASNGALAKRTRYEPYGLKASGDTLSIGFAGHVNDADTGLVYMQQRYYDPLAGRFLSTDPVTADANTGGSFNRYAYANNSPYKYIDPDGRDPGDPFKTLAEAAKDAIRFINPTSIKINLEFGGQLYKGADGLYRATEPVKGDANGVTVTDSPAPTKAEVVGDYHTHGNYSKTENGIIVPTGDKKN